MKKILFLSLATLMMVGCSNDDETKLSLSTNNISIYSEDTEEITANEKVTWNSDDEFVASVSAKGVVTGEHVGKTKVTATSSDGESQCQVEVKAKYNTYADPVFSFGANKSTIKSKETRTLDNETSTGLLFKPEKSTIGGVAYLFENEKMTGIGVNVKTASAMEATKFLIERYLVVAAGNGDIVGLMLNNLPNKADMSIAMGVKTGYVLVTYMPYDKKATSRSNAEKDRIAEELEKIFESAE